MYIKNISASNIFCALSLLFVVACDEKTEENNKPVPPLPIAESVDVETPEPIVTPATEEPVAITLPEMPIEAPLPEYAPDAPVYEEPSEAFVEPEMPIETSEMPSPVSVDPYASPAMDTSSETQSPTDDNVLPEPNPFPEEPALELEEDNFQH